MLREWGEEIMAIEPSAMRGFDRRTRSRSMRAELSGVTVEWDDGWARVGNVALVQIEGPLSRVAGWWSCGYDEILEAHDEAFRSDARAVLQVIHSPGGYISGLDETAIELEKMAKAAGKPFHALFADMAYSAAYRLACPTQKRWITRAGGAGSIGILTVRADWSKANEMAGIRYEQIASGDFKTDGSPDVPITKEEIARLRGHMMHHAGLFFDAAARATGLSVDEVRGQQAGIYLGSKAVDAKLCDGVSTLGECIARLEQQTSGRPMVAVPAGLRGQQSQPKGRSMENTVLAMVLGKVSPSASDQELTERATALRGLEDKLRDVTGKSEPSAAMAAIEGWKESASKLTEAQGELAKVREREEKAAHSALVRQGEESGQITGANRAKVLERFPTAAQLSAFLETAPSALPGRAAASDKPAAKPAEDKTAALTFKGKAYKDLSYSERAAWKGEDAEAWAQAKAEYDRQKGG